MESGSVFGEQARAAQSTRTTLSSSSCGKCSGASGRGRRGGRPPASRPRGPSYTDRDRPSHGVRAGLARGRPAGPSRTTRAMWPREDLISRCSGLNPAAPARHTLSSCRRVRTRCSFFMGCSSWAAPIGTVILIPHDGRFSPSLTYTERYSSQPRRLQGRATFVDLRRLICPSLPLLPASLPAHSRSSF